MKNKVEQAPLLLKTPASTRFHGAPDVEAALGFSNSANFYGKRVLFVGDIPGRWDITERMRAQRADVTVVDTFTDGNPQKRLTPKSKELRGKKYDRVALAMTPAFRNIDERRSLFKAGLKKVDFKNGGTLAVTGLEFTNFQTDSYLSDSETVQALGQFNQDFFETTGFDTHAGEFLGADLSAVINKKSGLEVVVTVNERPKGRGDWPEIADLVAFQGDVIDSALKSLPPDFIAKTFARGVKAPNGKNLIEFKRDLNILKARNIALGAEVNNVLALPEEDRPETQPPLIYTAKVSKKTN